MIIIIGLIASTLAIISFLIPDVRNCLIRKFKMHFSLSDFEKRKDSFDMLAHCPAPTRKEYNRSTIDHRNVFCCISYKIIVVYKYVSGKHTVKSPKEQPEEIKRTIDFFGNSVSPFSLNFASNDLDIPNTRGETPEDAIRTFLKPLVAKNRPSTITIVGKIGCGKTTLISSIVHNLYVNGSLKFGQTQLLPIFIDVRKDFETVLDRILDTEVFDEHETVTLLEERLIKVLKRPIMKNGVKYDEKAPDLNQALKHAYGKLLRPFIILDELDRVYYDFCRVSLVPDGIGEHERQKFFTVVNFFSSLSSKELEPGPVQSPLVLIAVRETTYRLFSKINLDGHTLERFNENLIKVSPTSTSRLKEIAVKRLDLKIKLLKDSGKTNNTEIDNINNIKDFFLSEFHSYKLNIELSVHGLRHLVVLFNKIEYIDSETPEADSGALLSLLTTPKTCFLVFQFLDGNPQYSQTNEGVANLFLVNVYYKKDLIKTEGGRSERRVDPLYIKEHLQTYLLKYFLMGYIFEKAKSPIGGVYLDEITRVFCRVDDEDYRVFEKEITSLALLHSTETDHGRLIRLEYPNQSKSPILIPTARLNSMYTRGLMWQFEYLMVVIEDGLLGFPLCIRTNMTINKPWQRSYNFTSQLNTLSDADKTRFIKYKSYCCIVFLTLLKVSYEFELSRYSRSFKRLNTETDTEIFNLNFDQKIAALTTNILSFSKSVLTQDSDCENIKNYLSDSNLSDKIKGHENDIREHFAHYHFRNNINSLKSFMEHWHRYGKRDIE